MIQALQQLTIVAGPPASGALDRGTALLAVAALLVGAVLVNVVARHHLPERRRKRRRDYGPDDVRRDGAAWNLGVGWLSWGNVRSQLHDRSGSGLDPRDPSGSDAGPDEDERGGRGPFLR